MSRDLARLLEQDYSVNPSLGVEDLEASRGLAAESLYSIRTLFEGVSRHGSMTGGLGLVREGEGVVGLVRSARVMSRQLVS